MSRQRLPNLSLLIANSDRHAENFLILADGRQVAIDHGLAFKPFTGPAPEWTMRTSVPRRAVYERLKLLGDSPFRQELFPLLGAERTEALIIRKNQFLTEIEKWIKADGAEAVFKSTP